MLPHTENLTFSRSFQVGTTENTPLGTTLGERVALELRHRWNAGQRVVAESLLNLHAELLRDPDAAIDVIYEEVILREAHGEEDPWPGMFARFPQWKGRLEALRDCHRLLEPTAGQPHFPEPGESLGEYVLVAELGRGALGRVFLATQPALANRPVVLKLTPRTGDEHLSLARLQHSHIVPLYTAREDRARRLRVLSMPFFGGATLAELLTDLGEIPQHARTGRHLLAALDRRQARLPAPQPTAGAARDFLANATYVQAVCWLGACFAEALHYAHEHGLVHLDLKPSNILIAADGQPLLLDFHLARAPLSEGQPAPYDLGGTLAYMPPEQRTAVRMAGEARPLPQCVDGRADLFALAAVMYEALGGEMPVGPTSLPLVAINPQVGLGLSDLLARCLAADPRQRYENGSLLAADLRRWLQDEPLRGVPNRSLTERWQKWRRRSPAALQRLLLTLTVCVALIGALIGGGLYLAEKSAEAEQALNEGRQQWQERHLFSESRTTLDRGRRLAERLPFRTGLVEQFDEQLRLAGHAEAEERRATVLRELHSQVEHLRSLFGADLGPGALAAVLKPCRQLWAERERLKELAEDRVEAITDLTDLGILLADLTARSAPTDDSKPSAHRAALAILDETQALFGTNTVLDHERAVYRKSLGLPMEPRPKHSEPRSAWDYYALGRAHLRGDDLNEAARLLQQAVRLEPHRCWPNYYYGLCAYRQGQPESAARAFSVCIGAASELPGCYYTRALALGSLGAIEDAVADCDQALRLHPEFAAAWLNRGVLHHRAGRHDAAIHDLHKALETGADPATVYYNLALVHEARAERRAALACLDRALLQSPGHPLATQLRRQLQDGP